MNRHRWSGRRKIFYLLAVLFTLVATAAFVYWPRYEVPADPRPNGAYTFDDGSIVVLASRAPDSYRAVIPDTGESRAFFATDGPVEEGGLRFHSGPGWASAEPVETRLTFQSSGTGEITGFSWECEGKPMRRATRIAHRETIYTFSSGELTLRGKLVTPDSDGPFPLVVLVHGSEAYSAVDYYSNPYTLAAEGFAVVAYDKRGTGKSEGKYTQNFQVLAQDALAAVDSVRERPEIDEDRVNLAGFSQGGWIAPLAASLSSHPIRSLVVGYGTPLPITEEDRWGYIYQLRKKGFGENEIRQADEINVVIEQIIDQGRVDQFDELGKRLDAARDQKWFSAVQGSDSMLGYLSQTRVPFFFLRVYFQYFSSITADRVHSSVPVLEAMDIPMLWIFGGEDSSLPTPSSIEALEEIKTRLQKPIDIVLYPEAEHGILRFEDKDGKRQYLGYEPGYFATMSEWLRRQNGLAPLWPPHPESEPDEADVL